MIHYHYKMIAKDQHGKKLQARTLRSMEKLHHAIDAILPQLETFGGTLEISPKEQAATVKVKSDRGLRIGARQKSGDRNCSVDPVTSSQTRCTVAKISIYKGNKPGMTHMVTATNMRCYFESEAAAIEWVKQEFKFSKPSYQPAETKA